MGDKSQIQWTDATWNPVTGCSKVSPGCAHCYAERVAIRLWPSQYPPVVDLSRHIAPGSMVHPTRPRQFTDVQCHEDRRDQPLRWKTPRKIFVNSMSDLFHEDVPDAFIERVFAVMGLAERHVFQVLTKRPERMVAWFRARRFDVKGAAILQSERGSCSYSLPWPLPNVWLGVSVENQHFADERIPLLLQAPAAVRFISAEPLLGPVDVSRWISGCRSPHGTDVCVACSQGKRLCGLDWVIVGGESGARPPQLSRRARRREQQLARPFDVAWARAIVAQCQAAGVPVFVKQLGANPIIDRVALAAGVFVPDYELHLRDSHGGDMAEWPADLRVRQFPELSRA